MKKEIKEAAGKAAETVKTAVKGAVAEEGGSVKKETFDVGDAFKVLLVQVKEMFVAIGKFIKALFIKR